MMSLQDKKRFPHKSNVRFVCRMAHVLFTLCVLACVEWCPTPIFVVFIFVLYIDSFSVLSILIKVFEIILCMYLKTISPDVPDEFAICSIYN
jgi:hypothetical protein